MNDNPHSHTRILKGLLVAGVFALAWFGLQLAPDTLDAQSSNPVSGYAWSDNIGWVSFNCSNDNSCSAVNYGVDYNSSTELLSGNAWSDWIGWVSFNQSDLSGCPSGSCEARISGGALTGWARALSASSNGWDGWIHLDGVTVDPQTGVFSGFAWGSDVVGWLSFDADANNPVQVAPLSKVTLTANPSSVQSGQSSVLRWRTVDMVSCEAFGDWSGIKNVANNGQEEEQVNGITQDSTFTLTCQDSGGVQHSDDATVTVVSSAIPQFTASVSPGTIFVSRDGGRSTIATIQVIPYNGYSQDVTVKTSYPNGKPANIFVSAPQTVAAGTSDQIYADLVGTSTDATVDIEFEITGPLQNGGSLTIYRSLQLIVGSSDTIRFDEF